MSEDNIPTPEEMLTPRLRHIIRNAHKMGRPKRKGQPLWSFVSDLTSHGSTYATIICRFVGWEPNQDASIYPPKDIVEQATGKAENKS